MSTMFTKFAYGYRIRNKHFAHFDGDAAYEGCPDGLDVDYAGEVRGQVERADFVFYLEHTFRGEEGGAVLAGVDHDEARLENELKEKLEYLTDIPQGDFGFFAWSSYI